MISPSGMIGFFAIISWSPLTETDIVFTAATKHRYTWYTAATKHRYIPRCQCRMANLWGIYGVRVIEVIYGGYMVKMGHIPWTVLKCIYHSSGVVYFSQYIITESQDLSIIAKTYSIQICVTNYYVYLYLCKLKQVFRTYISCYRR